MSRWQAKSVVSPSLASAQAAAVPLLCFWAIWELAASRRWIEPTTFPPPTKFVPYFFSSGFTLGIGPSSMSVSQAIAASLLRVFAGLLVAFVFALSFGLLLARFQRLRAAFVPLLQLLAPIAPIAWIPLAISIFKGGNAAAVFIVWTGIGATMTLATLARFQNVRAEYLSVAATLGASGTKLWYFVYIPAVLPEVYFLLRMNFFGAWTSVLAAEMVGLNTGLGAIILMGREAGNGELILIGMVLIGIVGFTVDVLLEKLGRAFFPWGSAYARG